MSKDPVKKVGGLAYWSVQLDSPGTAPLFACISFFWRHFELRHIYVHVHTDATLLDVTCFVRLHTLLHGVNCMLLRVVRSCCARFETGQTF